MVVACAEIFLVALVSYLIGSINLSIILSKLMGKGDIRDYGSKNAGTTNTLRVLGKGPALLVIIWDVLKGVIAVWLARFGFGIFENEVQNGSIVLQNVSLDYIYVISIFISSIAGILGHNYPIFFGFRGGKGVATSMGVILAIEPKIGLICIVAGIVGICLFQFVSVGSLIGSIEYPILVCIIGGQFDAKFAVDIYTRVLYIVFSFILAAMVIIRHKKNIERIKNGTENKLSFKKKPTAEIKNDEVQYEQEKAEHEEKVKEVLEEVNQEHHVEEPVDIKFEPVKKDKKKDKDEVER